MTTIKLNLIQPRVANEGNTTTPSQSSALPLLSTSQSSQLARCGRRKQKTSRQKSDENSTFQGQMLKMRLALIFPLIFAQIYLRNSEKSVNFASVKGTNRTPEAGG